MGKIISRPNHKCRKKKWRRPINMYILNKKLYIDIKVSFGLE